MSCGLTYTVVYDIMGYCIVRSSADQGRTSASKLGISGTIDQTVRDTPPMVWLVS